MDSDPTRNEEVKNEKNDGWEAHESASQPSQTFNKIGLLSAVGGVLYLTGRNGERDHLYPLHRAVKRYFETRKMVMAMFRNGMRGWDTLQEICDEMKAKILETIDQRRHMNLPVDEVSAQFEQQFAGNETNRLSPDNPGYDSLR